jgi:hypothetical protein
LLVLLQEIALGFRDVTRCTSVQKPQTRTVCSVATAATVAASIAACPALLLPLLLSLSLLITLALSSTSRAPYPLLLYVNWLADVTFTKAKVSRDTEFLTPLMFGLIVQSSQRSILHS